jgi:hypothetical protein
MAIDARHSGWWRFWVGLGIGSLYTLLLVATSVTVYAVWRWLSAA